MFFAGYPVAQSNVSVWLGRMASAAAQEPPVGLRGFQDPSFELRLVPSASVGLAGLREFGPV